MEPDVGRRAREPAVPRAAICCASASSSSCAWLVFEVGKNWAEADGDIAETIDFCEFYAREALRLAKAEPPVQLPGERDQLPLHSAGRGRGDSAVEFPVRHHGRHDAGLDRLRQHRDPEAVERFADHCGEIFRVAGRSRNAGRRCEFLSGSRRQLSATPSSRIRRRATSRSPDRGKSVCDIQQARRRRRRRVRSGSSARFSRWAARTRSSLMRMRISMRRSKAWPRRRSDSGTEMFGLFARHRR